MQQKRTRQQLLRTKLTPPGKCLILPHSFHCAMHLSSWETQKVAGGQQIRPKLSWRSGVALATPLGRTKKTFCFIGYLQIPHPSPNLFMPVHQIIIVLVPKPLHRPALSLGGAQRLVRPPLTRAVTISHVMPHFLPYICHTFLPYVCRTSVPYICHIFYHTCATHMYQTCVAHCTTYVTVSYILHFVPNCTKYMQENNTTNATFYNVMISDVMPHSTFHAYES